MFGLGGCACSTFQPRDWNQRFSWRKGTDRWYSFSLLGAHVCPLFAKSRDCLQELYWMIRIQAGLPGGLTNTQQDLWSLVHMFIQAKSNWLRLHLRHLLSPAVLDRRPWNWSYQNEWVEKQVNFTMKFRANAEEQARRRKVWMLRLDEIYSRLGVSPIIRGRLKELKDSRGGSWESQPGAAPGSIWYLQTH